MLTAEAHVPTERAHRYLAQLCWHFSNLGPHESRLETPQPAVVHVHVECSHTHTAQWLSIRPILTRGDPERAPAQGASSGQSRLAAGSRPRWQSSRAVRGPRAAEVELVTGLRSGTGRQDTFPAMADLTEVVTVERVVPAPPEKIFELLADPARHRTFDGSGSVRASRNAPPRLSLGAKFDMAMNLGFPYTMTNEVIEFEEGRRIAWQPRPAARLARSFGGRIWRYELDPVQAGTRVRETWDISQERWLFVRAGGLALGAPGLRFMVKRAAERSRAAMMATLERIEHLVTQP
jgi:hypothetical protein